MRRVIDPGFGERRDVLSQDWVRYLYSLWPELVLLPLVNHPDSVEKWAEDLQLDGALMSNGNNWGEEPDRDHSEERLLAWCRKRSRPILGVCRGFQVMNRLFGGSVHEDISSVDRHVHGGKPHDVALTADSFSDLAGGEKIAVNSYHDQGVVLSGLSADLRAFAMGKGEVVEGFYHPSEPILGFQWHPERPSDAQQFNDRLLKMFFSKGAFWPS
jgi:gamma-glutamyl-gamma-aminobutyrate hydrolase PuuD